MEDVLFISSPQFVKRASLGYSGLLADIYWMRVVQYFGSKHQRDSMEYRALQPLLDITTTLDPNLVIAYEWGSTFLQQPPPSGAGDDDAAIELIRRGIGNNPDNWHLYFTLGFIEYLGKHDYLAAAQAFEDGSKVPNAHPWLKIMAAKMLSDAGSIETARYMWQNIYNESTDKNLKQNAALHLASLAADQEMAKLESMIAEFRRRFSRNPSSWREMIATGMLHSIPRDPAGDPYVLSADGRVHVADPKKLPFVRTQ
jgi:tetratricopeptide (TPR) repeat protein